MYSTSKTEKSLIYKSIQNLKLVLCIKCDNSNYSFVNCAEAEWV